MRIGINGSFWDQTATGTGQYLRNLLPELARCANEHEYVVVVPETQATGHALRVMEEISPQVYLYPERVGPLRAGENAAKVWFEQRVFPRVCGRERVDLVHVPYWASPLFPPARTVVTIHDLIPLILPLYRGTLGVQAYTRLVAWSARRADAVIADSECSKRDIVQRLGIPAERVHVVYLAAHVRYAPVRDPAVMDLVRDKYGLPDRFLLYLGGFDQRKDVSTLIRAFAALPDAYAAGYRLVLAGRILGHDSEFFPDPLRIAREAGLPADGLQLIGGVDEGDKPALYACAELFMFPSLYEGFGLPVLEAMACGTPVLAADASSLPEVAGEAAGLVAPGDVDAWAAAIRRVLQSPARRAAMRAAGPVQAARFSWSRTARETLAVYRTLL